jgi:hypothetical protein
VNEKGKTDLEFKCNSAMVYTGNGCKVPRIPNLGTRE